MMTLIIFLGFIVWRFAGKYLQGDGRYHKFMGLLGLLVLSMVAMVSADNIWLFLGAWGISNFILIEMMIHKRSWQAAKASGVLTAKVLGFGFLCLLTAFILIAVTTHQSSIQHISLLSNKIDTWFSVALLLILLAGMAQSALWPFHRWLLSSLNSPTPTSAIMHAGLVNGGGFLLVRFAHLYTSHASILTLIFIVGVISAVLGTLWKLLQTDIKKMLACSTLAQMGFMFIQCGLGLFPAAVAHLCWHSLFKANLFLGFNSVAKEKRCKIDASPNLILFLFALVCGVLASYIFAMTAHLTWLACDTTFVLICVVFITATQLSLTLLQIERGLFTKAILAVSISAGLSALYGLNVWLFELWLKPMRLMQPQSLNIYYVIGIFLLLSTWLMLLFKNQLMKNNTISNLFYKYYVAALNASQPHPDTITTNRNQYQYK